MSLERILETAIGLIEKGSVEELSMRKLGDALGVGATTLYSYFPSKAALLLEIGTLMFRQIARCDPNDPDWKGQIRAQAAARYRLVERYPKTYPLFLSLGGTFPRSGEILESQIATLERAGFTHEDALNATLTLAEFQTGAALWEIELLVKGSRFRPKDREGREKAFAFGLELLLAGLEARLRGAMVPD